MKNYNSIAQRQSGARSAYARRMEDDEERRRREEEARQRAEEHRRQMEQQREAQQSAPKAPTGGYGAAAGGDTKTYQPAGTYKPTSPGGTYKPAAATSPGGLGAAQSAGVKNASGDWTAPKITAPDGNKSEKMFYTNGGNSGTIIPKLGSISAYQGAIKDGQKKLDDLNHQQYLLMLQNDIPGMAALDEPIKQAEQDIDNLKIGMGEVMGANVHGPSGNQLTGSGWFGRVMGLEEQEEEELRAPSHGKPLFARDDAKAHVTGLEYPVWPGYPTGPSPVEEPPKGEEDMEEYENDVEESLATGDEGLKKWLDQVSAFISGDKNDTESLPGPEPQAQPSAFIREEKENDPKDDEKREEDYKAFGEALGGLADFSEKNNTDDISAYVKAAIEKIENGEEIDKAAFFQTNPYSYGSEYIIPMGDVDVELEVLSQVALPQYGGNGTELQEMIDKVIQLFWPPFGNEITTVLGVAEGAIEDYYNPGQILQPGDTRIRVTSSKPIANQANTGELSYMIDYFFRGAELLYSKDNNSGEIVWGDNYKK